ncbi:unnamed protein product [Adineta steineri]|uniref:SAM-dependent MTase TRM10-type domain-containing protein n=1 Tax=Adineta steineri TaxID=433720 RepID=A0A815EXP6_9BILA|nr:unnamed protein product [Adineta steineri]CAF3683391.1 unnamed protein product [Adineta steineri]
MLIRHRGWQQIVNTKTKRSTPISVLRWTLLRHVTQSLNEINDDELKKNILREEMSWLNQYWAQPTPKSDLSLKYWQRLFLVKSLDVRRDFYEYLYDEEVRKERLRSRMEKRKEMVATMSDPNQYESLHHKTIFATLETKFNPQRWFDLYSLSRAARLGDFFVVDGGFEYAHNRHSYFSALIQRVFRCFKNIDRFHSPAYIVISDLSDNFQTSRHPLPHEHSTYFQGTRDQYIDLFDKDRLVYLTPDSPNVMTHFDHNAVYIVGGIYDDQNKEPLTYEKAVRQNIRHEKLPLDKYLTFHTSSSKALAFHEVYNILLTLKHTNNNWIKAFRYVPKRKIATRVEENGEKADEIEDEDEVEDENSEVK